MRGIGGLMTGALGLAVLESFLSTLDQQRSTRIDGLFGAPAAAARWLIDPTIPAIPDFAYRNAEATVGAAYAGGATTKPASNGTGALLLPGPTQTAPPVPPPVLAPPAQQPAQPTYHA